MSIREIRSHVQAALEKSIADSYEAFVDSQKRWWIERVEDIASSIAKGAELYDFMERRHAGGIYPYISRMFLLEEYHDKVIGLSPRYKEIAEKIARDGADEAKAHFIAKNTMKLENIIANKQLYGVNGMDIAPIRADARRGTFEGAVRIVFDDGTGFIVRNQLVWKVSPLGRPFYQYPTTFHDVMVGPDEMRAMMSESEMLEWSDPDHKGKRISKIEEVSIEKRQQKKAERMAKVEVKKQKALTKSQYAATAPDESVVVSDDFINRPVTHAVLRRDFRILNSAWSDWSDFGGGWFTDESKAEAFVRKSMREIQAAFASNPEMYLDPKNIEHTIVPAIAIGRSKRLGEKGESIAVDVQVVSSHQSNTRQLSFVVSAVDANFNKIRFILPEPLKHKQRVRVSGVIENISSDRDYQETTILGNARVGQ